MGWTAASLLIPAAATIIAIVLRRSRSRIAAWAWYTAVFGAAALTLLLNPFTFDGYFLTSDPELSAGQGLNLRGLGFLIGGGPAGVLTAIIVLFAVMMRVANGPDRSQEAESQER